EGSHDVLNVLVVHLANADYSEVRRGQSNDTLNARDARMFQLVHRAQVYFAQAMEPGYRADRWRAQDDRIVPVIDRADLYGSLGRAPVRVIARPFTERPLWDQGLVRRRHVPLDHDLRA